MDNVVSIADARPHLAGPALCLDCRHQWQAVAPIGTTVLDCPRCGAQKGARTAMIEREGEHFHCVCGNALWLIYYDREKPMPGHPAVVASAQAITYCPNCGLAGPVLK